MPTKPAHAWLDAARSHLHAARSLRLEAPRSSCSRAYYATFAATHAVLTHFQPAVAQRPRGHYRHGEVAAELRWSLLHNLNRRLSAFQIDFYREQIEYAYNLRVLADYQPLQNVSPEDAATAEDSAASVVRLAERILA